MYFSKKNKFFHGITFHHFHDHKKHKKSQGSITRDDFYKIIKFVGRRNIIDSYVDTNNYQNDNMYIFIMTY